MKGARDRSSIPGKGKRFFTSPRRLIRLCGPIQPPPVRWVTGRVKLTAQIPVPKINNAWSYTSTPHKPSWRCNTFNVGKTLSVTVGDAYAGYWIIRTCISASFSLFVLNLENFFFNNVIPTMAKPGSNYFSRDLESLKTPEMLLDITQHSQTYIIFKKKPFLPYSKHTAFVFRLCCFWNNNFSFQKIIRNTFRWQTVGP